MQQGTKTLDTLYERERFAEILSDPDRMGLTIEQIAEKFNISYATVYNRMRDPEIAKLIKKGRAERIKIELPKIDKALISKALKGDSRAIELLYSRWDDYIPKKQIDEFITENISPERRAMVKERLEEILKSKTTEKVLASLKFTKDGGSECIDKSE